MSLKAVKKRGFKNPNEPVTKRDYDKEMDHIKKELIKLIFSLNKLKNSLSLTKELNLKPETSLVKMGLKLDYQLSVITIRNQTQDILNYIKTNN